MLQTGFQALCVIIWLLQANVAEAASVKHQCDVPGSTAYTGIRIFKQYVITGKVETQGYILTECYLGKLQSVTSLSKERIFNSTIKTPTAGYHIARRRQYVQRTFWLTQSTIIGGVFHAKYDARDNSTLNSWAPLSPVVSDSRSKWIVGRVNKTVVFQHPILRSPYTSESAFPRTNDWHKYIEFSEKYPDF